MGARGWGRGLGGSCLLGTEFHFGKIKRVLDVKVVVAVQQCEGTEYH